MGNIPVLGILVEKVRRITSTPIVFRFFVLIIVTIDRSFKVWGWEAIMDSTCHHPVAPTFLEVQNPTQPCASYRRHLEGQGAECRIPVVSLKA